VPSLDELVNLSTEDIRAAVAAELPAGWKFHAEPVNGWAYARLEDAEGTLLWEDCLADPRLVFLNAYGWLVSRSTEPKHPVWRRRTHEVNPQQYTPRPAETRWEPVPDPEDLDPAEVQAVYQDPHSKRK